MIHAGRASLPAADATGSRRNRKPANRFSCSGWYLNLSLLSVFVVQFTIRLRQGAPTPDVLAQPSGLSGGVAFGYAL